MRIFLFLSAFALSLTAFAQTGFEESGLGNQDSSVFAAIPKKVSYKFMLGHIRLGERTSGIYKIKNSGATDIRIKSTFLQGDDFFLDMSGCVSPIQPGQTCIVKLDFVPTKLGTSNGVLEIDFQNWSDYEFALAATATE